MQDLGKPDATSEPIERHENVSGFDESTRNAANRQIQDHASHKPTLFGRFRDRHGSAFLELLRTSEA